MSAPALRLALPSFAALLLALPAQAAPFSFATPGDVVLSPTQAPGAWYPDRYPPSGFVGGATAPDGTTGVLHVSISAGDADGSRPAGFNAGFYDYQGRKYDLPAGATSMNLFLYVSSTWAHLNQTDPNGNPANYGGVASLWATGVNGSNNVVSFPIIGFNNTDNAGGGGFAVFDQTNGWTPLPGGGGFSGYDRWYDLGFALDGPNVDYFVNGSHVYTDTTPTGATALSNVILEGYIGGPQAAVASYDVFWARTSSRRRRSPSRPPWPCSASAAPPWPAGAAGAAPGSPSWPSHGGTGGAPAPPVPPRPT
jgi:hypothetical protein